MRTFTILLCSVAVVIGLDACAGIPGMHNVVFSKADFAQYAGDGPAKLDGAAVGRTRGGKPITCAGYPVYLAPANPYDEDGINRIYTIDAVPLAAGPALTYWRKTACDAQGKFEFVNIPTGTWYVLTSISYEVASPTPANPMATETQSGFLARKLDLHAGQNNIVLTNEDNHSMFKF